MNLIEQLGGYERAKNGWLREGAYPSPNYFYYRQLGYELLEYRRANNIFEVNDRVIILTMHIDNKLVHDVTKVIENLIEVCGSYLYGSEIRHATDAEIKAGHRISHADNLSHFDHCSDIRNHLSPLTGVTDR